MKPHYAAFASALEHLLDQRGMPPLNRGRLECFLELVGPGHSRSTVHRWLHGLSIPDFDVLMRLCDLLHCTLDELMGRVPPGRSLVEADYFSGGRQRKVELPRPLIDRRNRTGPFGLLRVVGNEMAGYLDNDDCAFFDMGQRSIVSGSCYVLRSGDNLVVRRLRVSLSQRIDVLCENPLFPAESLESAQFVTSGPDDDLTKIYVKGLVFARYELER